MTTPLWTDDPRELLHLLHRLVAERAPAETAVTAEFAARNRQSEDLFQESRRTAAVQHAEQTAAIEGEQTASRRQIVAQFQADHGAARREYDEVRQKIASRFAAAQAAIDKTFQEARWEAGTIFEATKKGLDAQRQERDGQLAGRARELDSLAQSGQAILRRRGQGQEPRAAEGEPPPAEADYGARLQESAAQARKQLQDLARQPIARLVEGAGLFGLFLLVLGLAVLPGGLLLGWTNWYWIALSLGIAVPIWGGLSFWLTRLARRQTREAYAALCRTLADAGLTVRAAQEAVKAAWERQTTAAAARRNADLKQAADRHVAETAELEARRLAEVEAAEKKYPALMAEIVARRDRDLQAAEEKYASRLAETNQRHREESDAIYQRYAQATADSQQQFQREWQEMAGRWTEGMARFRSGIEQIETTLARVFPDWDTTDWARWSPPASIPPVVPFGRLRVSLERIERGIPRDERLRPERIQYTLPGAFPFRDHSLLLLKAAAEGRAVAVETLQAVMLRLLTAMPPGKVRLTIVDPVGLGENFSAFMHLADFNDQVVTSRIWTDAPHIDERLSELTGHMENVLQVYLRNEFATIQEYNEFAGEMAEPYRILVVANFPTNFSESAARRLKSIVSSGARCGVYTLLSVDTRLKMPRDFHLADLERDALRLRWQEDRFVWEDDDFSAWPLELDRPPEAERFTEVVRTVGRHVRDADRVEVPFEAVAPDERAYWTTESRGGIDVPLGRAGAMKLQHLQLGKGTSQHVLISGKTGSGKSTLLHALVTNVALRYSPDEVELYLVDFKKGVEFKAYAQAALPHARVIAIESEREFGLSVLERLDLELKRRGDLFRAQNVQDLPAYRGACPDVRLPRVLLIVDEFQELFVEDDRIAQNASLLLDRLVRQGRAFGIHVLLGSQTLAGAYSLPRSTIGQMAVRIALQCSDADAHLILSEENTAARLLSRPGEAIYNDANGLFEGNHPFQVVWLPDDRREFYLDQVREFARKREYRSRGAIVFEGNVPADLAANPALSDLLAAPAWPPETRSARSWLGAAVAIKDPTSVVFTRQSGSHLLVVGHQEEDALGVLASATISLAAQHAPGDATADGTDGPAAARFYFFDGTRPDSPAAGFWTRLAELLPHAAAVLTPRAAGEAIGPIAEELARREASGREDHPPIYLVVFDVGRFRSLRKGEDDFGFSRFDEDKPPPPGKLFQRVLHDGPAVGIHALIWCDSYNNAMRQFDRQGLHDMEYRVLFQMNSGDSSNLIDSPAAGQLGVHRAIVFNESDGTQEKFRPYGPPTAEHLAQLVRQFALRLRAGTPA